MVVYVGPSIVKKPIPAPTAPSSAAYFPDVPLPSVRAPSSIAVIATPDAPPIAAPKASFLIRCFRFTLSSLMSARVTFSNRPLSPVSVRPASVEETILPLTVVFLSSRTSTNSPGDKACTLRHCSLKLGLPPAWLSPSEAMLALIGNSFAASAR